MIDTKALRSRILDLAIQGKLTEQLPSDGTAEELYQQIHAEKQALINEGKIKKEKPLPEISADEIPFEIPNNWMWMRLGNFIHIESGKGLTAHDMKEGCIPVYGGNGINGYHSTANVHKKTVVIGRVGVNCGSVHLTEENAWVTDNAFITTYPEKHINQEFLVHTLRFLNLGERQNATAQPVISGKKIYPVLFPIPPLAEQKRIVERVEEIFRLLDTIDEAQEKYSADSQILKAKLITAGIQGKLTKQLPSDGTAEELFAKKLKAIEDTPFDIPDNWKWCKGVDCFKPMESRKPTGEYFHYIDIDAIDNKHQRIDQIKTVVTKEAPSRASRAVFEGSTLFSLVRPYLRNIAFVDSDASNSIASTGFFVATSNGSLYPLFLYYLMISDYVVMGLNEFMKGDNSPSIRKGNIEQWLFPVPPLAEQKRIADVLERALGEIG